MADLATSLQTAKKAGYSDKEITDYLAQDPSMGAKVATARQAGYGDDEIVAHLADSVKPAAPAAPAPKPYTIAGEIAGAVDRLKTDVKTAYSNLGSAQGGAGNPGAKPGTASAARITAADSIGGDLLDVVTSPVKGFVTKYVNKPLASVTGLSEQDISAVEQGLAMAAGNRLGRVGEPVAPRAAPKVNALAAPVAAFDRAGVNPMLATASGGKGAATGTNVVAENALAGPAVRARLRTAVGQAGDSANALATQYGEVRGPQITGENVQAGVNNFARSKETPSQGAVQPAKAASFAAKSEKLYDDAFLPIETAEARNVERFGSEHEANVSRLKANHDAEVSRIDQAHAAAVVDAKRQEERRAGFFGQSARPIKVPDPVYPEPPQLPGQRPAVVPTQTIATLNEVAGRVNGQQLSNLITDAKPRAIASALENDAHNVRFRDLRELRTWVRNAQGNPELRQGITAAGLQRIEQSLTADIYSSAERLGGKPALQRLQRADQFYKAGQGRIKTALQPFDDAKSGESAYGRIVQAAGSTASADAQKLLSLKRSLQPAEFGDVAANVLSELGKPTAGAAPAGGGGFSPSTFVTNYNKLTPRSRDILFGSIGGGGSKATNLKAELDNLAEVVDRLKGIEKGANTSKTAVNAQSLATAAPLLHPATAPVAAGLLGAEFLTGEMLTNPAVVRWLARTARAEKASPAAYTNTVKQLGYAAKSNVQLLPLYQQLALEAPRATTAVAAQEEPSNSQ